MVVKNYPKDIKAFYMRMNEDSKTVAAMDVLAPGIGEIIGGSQREERLDVLDQRLEEMGLNKDYWWYRDLRRYGTVPHSGFGLGFERLIAYVTGVQNVRDVIPFHARHVTQASNLYDHSFLKRFRYKTKASLAGLSHPNIDARHKVPEKLHLVTHTFLLQPDWDIGIIFVLD